MDFDFTECGPEPVASSEDLCIWPDGTWCYRGELSEYDCMSDDFEVVHENSLAWFDFLTQHQ